MFMRLTGFLRLSCQQKGFFAASRCIGTKRAEPRAAKSCPYCVRSCPALQASIAMPLPSTWPPLFCPLSTEVSCERERKRRSNQSHKSNKSGFRQPPLFCLLSPETSNSPLTLNVHVHGHNSVNMIINHL